MLRHKTKERGQCGSDCCDTTLRITLHGSALEFCHEKPESPSWCECSFGVIKAMAFGVEVGKGRWKLKGLNVHIEAG